MKKANMGKPEKGQYSRGRLAQEDRETNSPWQWMPVPFPGLTLSQLEVLAQKWDRQLYAPPRWLQMPQSEQKLETISMPDLDRDPTIPWHWTPLPLPILAPD